MNLEIIVAISLVLNFICLYLIFRIYNNSERQGLFIDGIRTQLPTAFSNLHENILAVHTNFVEFTKVAEGMMEQMEGMAHMMMSGKSHGAIYKTKDGKIVANSLDELINKIKEEEQKEENDDWSDIKKMFEDDHNEEN